MNKLGLELFKNKKNLTSLLDWLPRKVKGKGIKPKENSYSISTESCQMSMTAVFLYLSLILTFFFIRKRDIRNYYGVYNYLIIEANCEKLSLFSVHSPMRNQPYTRRDEWVNVVHTCVIL